MSASEDSIFTRPFASMLVPVARAHSPYCYRCPLGLERATCASRLPGRSRTAAAEHGPRTIAGVHRRADAAGRGRHDRLAGGVSGGRAAPVRPLRRADDRRRGADRFRPDRPDVCVRARGSTPDIICLSKALTAGYLPLGVTAATEPVYDAFLSDDRTKTFFHGHSFTANPLACAVAIASLDLFHETQRARAGAPSRALASRGARAAWRSFRPSATSASSAASASSSSLATRRASRPADIWINVGPRLADGVSRSRPAAAAARQHPLLHAAVRHHRVGNPGGRFNRCGKSFQI